MSPLCSHRSWAPSPRATPFPQLLPSTLVVLHQHADPLSLRCHPPPLSSADQPVLAKDKNTFFADL